MANLNPSYGQYINSILGTTAAAGGTPFVLARVTHVVRGPFLEGTTVPDKFYQNPTDIGNVAFQLLNSAQTSTLVEAGNILAKPMFAAIKQYPVQGEIVYIIAGPSIEMNDNRGARSFFYLPPYNMWGSSHHNAFPDLGDVQVFADSINRSYENTATLNQPINTGVTGSNAFPLEYNFIERSDIKVLRQFIGDVTLEGRWGNSIRLGSTTGGKVKENPWSTDSVVGNPITIIRNGQGKTADNVPWVPTVEDINRDPSSIYLTQGQKIVIDDIQKNFSLISLGVKLEQTQTNVIPVQQQLTSTATTSAQEQDKVTKQIIDPGTV